MKVQDQKDVKMMHCVRPFCMCITNRVQVIRLVSETTLIETTLQALGVNSYQLQPNNFLNSFVKSSLNTFRN